MRWPWWARPDRLRRQIDELRDVCDEYKTLTARLNDENRDQQLQLTGERAKVAELSRQLTNMAAPRGSGQAVVGWQAPGTAKPEFVLAGVDRGNGKRLYASKDLGGTSFGGAAGDFGTNVGYTLRAVLGNMLIIDKPSYGECLEFLFRRWADFTSRPVTVQSEVSPSVTREITDGEGNHDSGTTAPA